MAKRRNRFQVKSCTLLSGGGDSDLPEGKDRAALMACRSRAELVAELARIAEYQRFGRDRVDVEFVDADGREYVLQAYNVPTLEIVRYDDGQDVARANCTAWVPDNLVTWTGD